MKFQPCDFIFNTFSPGSEKSLLMRCQSFSRGFPLFATRSMILSKKKHSKSTPKKMP
nr:MAG TPA: hypothetical protein [Caudoviricetes sp.]